MTRKMTTSWAGAIIVAVMLGATDASAQKQAGTEGANRVFVFKTAQPVAVDGVLDDACWKQASPIKADYILGGNGTMADAPQMQVMFAWDNRYLYIAYETFDTNLVAKGCGVVKGQAGNRRENLSCFFATNLPLDRVEFHVGFNDPNMYWQILHNAENCFFDLLQFVGLPAWKKEPSAMASDVYYAVNEYIDDGSYKVASAVRLKTTAKGKPSTVCNGSDVDTGYTAELRLPWAGIGAPLSAQTADGWGNMTDRLVAILAVVYNGDSGSYHTACPTLPPGGVFNLNFDKWPRYRLVAEPGAPAGK
jgi:hypothetical protein